MFEYGYASGQCKLMPHTRLKDRYFTDVAQKEDTEDVAIYVLQCSKAQENVLSFNEFYTQDVK